MARLIASGVPVDSVVDGRSALDMAITEGHASTVRLLAAAGADLESQVGPYHHTSPLHWAVHLGHFAVVEALLDAGVSPNLRDDRHQPPRRGTPTALAMAAARGTDDHRAVAAVLLRRGADIHATMRRRTALEWAAGSGQVAMVRYLLVNGARPTATAVGLARHAGRKWPESRNRYDETVAALLAAGAPDLGDDCAPPSTSGTGRLTLTDPFPPVGGSGRRRVDSGSASPAPPVDE